MGSLPAQTAWIHSLSTAGGGPVDRFLWLLPGRRILRIRFAASRDLAGIALL